MQLTIIHKLILALTALVSVLTISHNHQKKLGQIELKWLYSYETFKFDSQSGKLELNQYAKDPWGGLIVNEHGYWEPHSLDYPIKREWTRTSSSSQAFATYPTPLTEVHLKGKQWFDVFEGQDKSKIEVPITQAEYKELDRPNTTARHPSKIESIQ